MCSSTASSTRTGEQLAVLEERQRLARELHDSVAQLLYGVTLYAEAAARSLRTGNTEAAIGYLTEVRNTSQEALSEMRLLIFELRPPMLAQEGLVGALQARLEAVEARAGFKAELHTVGVCRLRPDLQEDVYRIAQEALNNVLKHARAGHVTVSLHFGPTDDTVNLTICDDGIGFLPTVAHGGLGLCGIRERVRRRGGNLEIRSAPGQGTTLIVQLGQQIQAERSAGDDGQSERSADPRPDRG